MTGNKTRTANGDYGSLSDHAPSTIGIERPCAVMGDWCAIRTISHCHALNLSRPARPTCVSTVGGATCSLEQRRNGHAPVHAGATALLVRIFALPIADPVAAS